MAGGCGGVAAMALPPLIAIQKCTQAACDDRGDNQNCNRVLVLNSHRILELEERLLRNFFIHVGVPPKSESKIQN